MGRLSWRNIVLGIAWLVSQTMWTPSAQAESVTSSRVVQHQANEETPPPIERAAPPEPASAAETSGTTAPDDLTARSVDDPQAQAEQQAREAFQRGDRLYLEGDYEGAVIAFDEAYAKSGRIEMLFNLANAHERLGNYAEAALLLRGYIPHSPHNHRPALERRLERLERLDAQEKATLSPAVPGVMTPQKNAVPWPRLVGVGLTTLGGAALLTGVGFALSAAHTRNKLDDVCVERNTGRLCPPEAESLLERDKAHSIVADVALLAGAVLATTGIVLIVTTNQPGKRGELVATPGLGSIWVRGTF